jgi:hypothetical protein
MLLLSTLRWLREKLFVVRNREGCMLPKKTGKKAKRGRKSATSAHGDLSRAALQRLLAKTAKISPKWAPALRVLAPRIFRERQRTSAPAGARRAAASNAPRSSAATPRGDVIEVADSSDDEDVHMKREAPDRSTTSQSHTQAFDTDDDSDGDDFLSLEDRSAQSSSLGGGACYLSRGSTVSGSGSSSARSGGRGAVECPVYIDKMRGFLRETLGHAQQLPGAGIGDYRSFLCFFMKKMSA